MLEKIIPKKYGFAKDIAEIIFAFAVAWLFYQGLAFAAGTPMPIVAVVSDSMEPILHRGDLLLSTRIDEPQAGDIVIYQGQRFTVVHRIVELTENGYITKGDNNLIADPPIRREQVFGKVWFAVPLLGYPRLALYAVGI